MRLASVLPAVFCILAPAPSSAQQVTQQASQRDPQAVAVLVSAFKALGGNLPADSVATGNIQIVAGSRTESGTIRVLTKGYDQTVEEINATYTHRSVVYSKGIAAQTDDGVTKSLPEELAVTSQAHDFPLQLIAAALSDQTVASAYVGLETLNGVSAHHLRIWRVFPSQPGLEHLADFSAKNLWVDAATGRPLKLAYIRRAAFGARLETRVEVIYSDYRNVNGIICPFRIEQLINGTHWADITIDQILLSTGLTDNDFPVR